MPKPLPEYVCWIVRLFVFTYCVVFPFPVTGQEDSISLNYLYPPDLYLGWKEYPSLRPFESYMFSPVQSYVVYDAKRERYLLYTSLGEENLTTPLSLSVKEYMDYRHRLFQTNYFREKNSMAEPTELIFRNTFYHLPFRKRKKDPFFGPGGLRFRIQGKAELTFGLRHKKQENPLQPVSSRKRIYPFMDEKIRLEAQAGIGTKLNLDIGYNTESMDGINNKKLRLSYTGDEDDFIKLIEAGQVTMTTNNSLIQAGSGLFGIKADLQFGKLRVNTVLAQQESQSRKIQAKANVRKKEFELRAHEYEENCHFFLGHYFRDGYDQTMEHLPHILSLIRIHRIEVWVTNQGNSFENARNIIAFSDLGEQKYLSHPQIQPVAGLPEGIPENRANSLYDKLLADFPASRNISQVTHSLGSVFEIGKDYEKVESARLLQPSEYTLQDQLGYISLHQPLQTGQVLAVAFQYTYRGEVYQVGEFSTEQLGSASECLYVKLLSSSNHSPAMPVWKLMMKNVYSLSALFLKKESFRMDLLFQHDSTGIALPYLPEEGGNKELLLRIMNLDRLDINNNLRPDGLFDFVEGYTVLSAQGKIIFPVTEPFGNHLKQKLSSSSDYIFQELYDSTKVYARQLAEKNKFILRGEFRGESRSEIALNMTGILPGTVRASSGGVLLQENIDYIVDYIGGTITLLNQDIIHSNAGVEVDVENHSLFSSQRKTMAGIELQYRLNDQLTLGTTLLHLAERPQSYKGRVGEEHFKNTVWGVNIDFRKENHKLMERLNKHLWLDWKKPFGFHFKGEYARLFTRHAIHKEVGDYSYLDDFENAKTSYDLSNPYAWQLASTPYHDIQPLFPEASLVNDIRYGNNRSLLAWYYIDGIFTRTNSGYMPEHIKRDKDQLSNHYVRGINNREIFPAREQIYGEYNQIPVLNLAYYPDERGPYNLDAENVDTEGRLIDPAKRWGGIMRKIEWSDFDAVNVDHIEFWLLDPFIYDRDPATGGELYINLGEVSEDILKDEKKFFENGLPIDGDLSKTETTVWGRVPLQQSMVYAFENSSHARRLQDVGLNGISSEDEKSFPAYAAYLDKVVRRVSAETFQRWETDPFSPLNDPAGDNFHHFRGTDYDLAEVDILTRYKRYNGTEGNSCLPEDSPERYDTSARSLPDIEDINQDNTLNEQEKYYEYKLSVRPDDLVPGKNYVVDSRTATVRLENGKEESVTWYQFKIPVRQFNRRIGNIQGFNSIRFMRMYLTGFTQPVVLRFASFGLVRGEWRVYEQQLSSTPVPVVHEASCEVTVVNLEENSDRTPVNYILPPDVNRQIAPSQSQMVRQNEQSLAIKTENLSPEDMKAVYKEVSFDLRFYKRLQLFVHAEALPEDETALQDGEVCLFLRLGSDYRNNYYEYEIPLVLTPPGRYQPYNRKDQETVWPFANRLDIYLSSFTTLKQNRNRLLKEKANHVSWQTPYRETDLYNLQNTITVCGNPSLAEVNVCMIGIRNISGEIKQVEVWVNELRVHGYEEEGGWATKGMIDVDLSDFGTFHLGGHFESSGFGSPDQNRSGRRMEDYSQYNFSTSLDFGKLLPAKWEVRLPFYYAWQKEQTTPVYNPFDTDILLPDTLLQIAKDRTVHKSIAFNGVNLGIRSKVPMPYDPVNFTFSYAYSETSHQDPAIHYENTRDYRAVIEYLYIPVARSVRPFAKHTSPGTYLYQLSFFYLPAHISFISILSRHYSESESRKVSLMDDTLPFPVSFTQQFLWNRSFILRWNLTNHLQASFQSGTQARIEEPHMQVNKKLNPDRYQVWKDSVRQSLLHLGQPLAYDQDFQVTYHVPFSLISPVNWLQATIQYQARYNWERTLAAHDSLWLGHTIQNQSTRKYQGGISFLSLYNKNKTLRRINSQKPHNVKYYLLRFLMSVRRLQFSYEQIEGMTLSGFRPEPGDILGQKKFDGKLAPGWKFAFGAVNRGYIEKAHTQNWLVQKEENTNPAMMRHSGKFSYQVLLEPLSGFKIELTADRLNSRTTQIRYMYPGMPHTYGGSFTMTTVTLRNDFDRFLSNREIIAQRIEDAYKGVFYPANGFLQQSPDAGKPYRSGSVNRNSADVLIPAFLAAYQGKDAGNISLTPFLSVKKLLPNWKVLYEGLVKFPFLRDHFRTILLSHQYRGVYNISGYSSYLNRVETEEGKGFIPASQSNSSPVPAAPWQISNVSIADGFTPLVGVDVTMKNNMTISTQFNKVRNLNLSITAVQLMESYSRELVLGIGYKTKELYKLFPRLYRKGTERVFSLRMDFMYRKNESLIRKIEESYTQMIAGNSTKVFHFLSEYNLSRFLGVRLFFDVEVDNPLFSATTYPSSQIQGGVTLLLTFNQ